MYDRKNRSGTGKYADGCFLTTGHLHHILQFLSRRLRNDADATFENILILHQFHGLMFDSPSDPTITRIVVTKQGIEDKTSFDYEHDPFKKPVRMMIPVSHEKEKASKGHKTFA